jgi:hypothetical protein
MSINASTNAALARRPDFEQGNAVPRNLAEVAIASGAPPRPAPSAGGPPPPTTTSTNTALQAITMHIPTEVLTLYVAAVASLGSIKGPQGQEIGRWLPFWCFLVLTPLAHWLIFASKLKAAGKPIPLSPATWPKWEMSAATIAYIVWAFALPDSPFAQFYWYSSGLAGFIVLVISWGLGALGPLMQRPLSTGAQR